MTRTRTKLLSLKVFLWVLLSGPAAYLAYHWWGLLETGEPGPMGANPIEFTTRMLGDHALRFLVLALAISPISRLLKKPWIVGVRRLVGVFAFFMVVLHLMSYVALDLYFDWPAIGKDILKRNFITVGMASFILLTPLALTSPKRMMKRLGGRKWRRLHSTVYFINVMAVIHYSMMVRGHRWEPLVYMMIVTVLLAERYWRQRKL